jgi:hypothetical protein
MPVISFKTQPFTVNGWTIILLPKEESAKLPSRGQVMVQGTVNGTAFATPLEPDGNGSHWLRITKGMEQAGIAAGETVTVGMDPTTDWVEPGVPADWQAALDAHPQERELWKKITPMARWEWIRWIGCSAQPQTRQKHIEVSISKLSKGMRRPCCFNRAMCCVPEVSKGGVLLEPAHA